MLSYQHAYHAGSRADVHKHAIIARALESLIKDKSPLVYVDTHAGRGAYDLTSVEAMKTGEAGQGWLEIIKDKKSLGEIPKPLVDTVRAMNKGRLDPRYPGSPMLAANMLRKADSMRLFELHPAEYTALLRALNKDPRVVIKKSEGLESVLSLKIPRGLILIDPSYEVKSEYETVPEAAIKIHRQFPKAAILIWAPMLPAAKHEILLEKTLKFFPEAQVSKYEWAKLGEVRGMYGSLMLGINAPPVF